MAQGARLVLGRPREPSLASGLGGSLGAVRGLHGGFGQRFLEKLDRPRHTWMKEVDQAPDKASIRRQKELYLRDRGAVHTDLKDLLSEDSEARRGIESTDAQTRGRELQSKRQREDVNEAMRMYRVLRPDAPPFFEEDAQLSMQAKAGRVFREGGLVPAETKFGDPFKAYLPVVNPNAFLLALESVVASLADDVETMCLLAGVGESALPADADPLRFKKLTDLLFSAFPLKKDPGDVDRFMEDSWPRLRTFLPRPLAELDEDVVRKWLQGHLRRVCLNQQRLDPRIFVHKSPDFASREDYSFAEDFPYDDDPLPADLIDERNLDFPLEQAGEFMGALLGALGQSPIARDATVVSAADLGDADQGAQPVAEQFQDFVWDLERVGLRNWLRMDVQDLERYLPKGEVRAPPIDNEGDLEVAEVLLECAARDRANLLDFDAVDPFRLMHDLPSSGVREQLAALPPHKRLSDAELRGLVDSYVENRRSFNEAQKTDAAWMDQGASVDQVFQKELDFYRNGGPVEWQKGEDGAYTWKWRQPANTFWDNRRKVYVPLQSGVDPNLDLKELRQHMLEVRRCGSMSKSGRVNYFRALVVVGNGKGVYGFGVGFANTPKEARSDGAIKALQNLDYIDADPGRMYPFPVKGMEYKQACQIVPRPIGRGIKCRKKFYPLAYILGLDNCKLRFPNWKCRWFTRVRAIKRTLEQLVSRRTLANMTGKKHALLVAPGDHWVHWPDRWFEQIRKPHDDRAALIKLKRRYALRFKKRGNTVAVGAELTPGWKKDVWSKWATPVEKFVQHSRHFPRMNKMEEGDKSALPSAAAGQDVASGAARPSAGAGD